MIWGWAYLDVITAALRGLIWLVTGNTMRQLCGVKLLRKRCLRAKALHCELATT